jgi:hypothetical protein
MIHGSHVVRPLPPVAVHSYFQFDYKVLKSECQEVKQDDIYKIKHPILCIFSKLIYMHLSHYFGTKIVPDNML